MAGRHVTRVLSPRHPDIAASSRLSQARLRGGIAVGPLQQLQRFRRFLSAVPRGSQAGANDGTRRRQVPPARCWVPTRARRLRSRRRPCEQSWRGRAAGRPQTTRTRGCVCGVPATVSWRARRFRTHDRASGRAPAAARDERSHLPRGGTDRGARRGATRSGREASCLMVCMPMRADTRAAASSEASHSSFVPKENTRDPRRRRPWTEGGGPPPARDRAGRRPAGWRRRAARARRAAPAPATYGKNLRESKKSNTTCLAGTQTSESRAVIKPYAHAHTPPREHRVHRHRPHLHAGRSNESGPSRVRACPSDGRAAVSALSVFDGPRARVFAVTVPSSSTRAPAVTGAGRKAFAQNTCSSSRPERL